MCCTQAKLALPVGGAPYFQRLSSLQALAAPVADVERRVGEDEVGLEVGVPVVVEGVAVGDLAVDAADGEVHLGQPPGGVVRLLAVDGDVADACRRAASTNSSDCTNMPAGAAAGVVDAALVGLEHLDQQLDHAARRVELAALLALGAGELREEVLVDAAEESLARVSSSPSPMLLIRSISSPSRCLSSAGRA